MLSRHFLRSKVLQTLYSCNVSDGNDIDVVQKNFMHNIESFNRLEINQIYTLVHLRNFAANFIEEGKQKFIPTEADKNPNMRFVDNAFIRQIAENHSFCLLCNDMKADLVSEDAIFRKLHSTLRENLKYKEYMSAPETDYATDKAFAIEVFKYVVNEQNIIDYFNDESIFWESDYMQTAQLTLNILKKMDESFTAEETFPLIYDSTSQKEADDVDFAKELLNRTLLSWDEHVDIITKNLNGWEYDRVPVIDIILIKMAITEFINCPSIPEPVTIDEYIELSKEFSTDRSKLFINGILDRIQIELRAKGKIQKSGRGLYQPNNEE
ncbi:MAG: transcription antitermination protein NusB [Bacteroidales bacterium]|nr:transcription antitermination protein NusB [Bacteroidales bacterium]